MSRTTVITGAASGIGAATVARLTSVGQRVIGVDLHNADIEADLGTPAGREHMIAEVMRMAPDGIDGVLAGAGISYPTMLRQTIAINYFGAVATLEGLRPLLARSSRPRAVAICSTAAMMPYDQKVVNLCLADDEPAALRAVEASHELAYATSKAALAFWVRRTAAHAQWSGLGILLNGIGPGFVMTPMNTPLLDQPDMMDLVRKWNPIAVASYAQPEEIAELIDFLLGMENHYLVGQIIYIDGGTDMLLRPENI